MFNPKMCLVVCVRKMSLNDTWENELPVCVLSTLEAWAWMFDLLTNLLYQLYIVDITYWSLLRVFRQYKWLVFSQITYFAPSVCTIFKTALKKGAKRKVSTFQKQSLHKLYVVHVLYQIPHSYSTTSPAEAKRRLSRLKRRHTKGSMSFNVWFADVPLQILFELVVPHDFVIPVIFLLCTSSYLPSWSCSIQKVK